MAFPAVAMLVMACNDGGESAVSGDERLQVVATIAVVDALARSVAGDLADVTVLAGIGADPHHFEPPPSSRRDLDAANVVLQIGLGLDTFVDDSVDDERLVTLSEGLHLRRLDDDEHEDEDEDEHGHEGEYDPHVWHDPENDKLMVDAIAEAFSVADPANADSYRANADAEKARLDAADREIRELLDSIPPENRKMVTDHDAFGYFIDRYGLTLVGAVIPSTAESAEASAADYAELIDTIERENVMAIFAESSVHPDVANQLGQDAGVRVVDDLYGDALGEPGSGADTIEGMLVSNARKIAEALS
jgi:ABC-type Zn uptake system ZnuABC Zn-binding protein ZnuA